MKQKTKFIASLIATIIVALCCFTPVLVILLGVLGLSALVGYLDYILIPALGILFSLTIYSYLRYQKSSKNRGKIMLENCCNETETKKSVTCPVNNQKGKPVKTTTLQSLIKAESFYQLITLLPIAYSLFPDFCKKSIVGWLEVRNLKFLRNHIFMLGCTLFNPTYNVI